MITVGFYGTVTMTDKQLLSLFPDNLSENFGVQFRSSPSICDVAIVVNDIKSQTAINCRQGYLWKIVMEPASTEGGINDYVDNHPEYYDRIFTHVFDLSDQRVVTSPPYLRWRLGKTFSELEELSSPPQKQHLLSAISSTKGFHPGHRNRNIFIQMLEKSGVEVDIFGHGRPREIDDKYDALAPYKFSVAIENASQANYWTEKIIDCFLTYTVPFYFGAPNIGKYFPSGSFIWLPIDEPKKAIEIIQDTISDPQAWEKRLSELEKARRLVLGEYNLYLMLAKIIQEERNEILNAERKKLDIPQLRPLSKLKRGIVQAIRSSQDV